MYDEILLTPLHTRKPVKLIAIAYILPLDVYTRYRSAAAISV